MYNDMTLENMDKKCPAKILCQAFESREIFGKVFHIKIFLYQQYIFQGGSQSYLSLFYQFINSMNFTSNQAIDDNYLTVSSDL